MFKSGREDLNLRPLGPETPLKVPACGLKSSIRMAFYRHPLHEQGVAFLSKKLRRNAVIRTYATKSCGYLEMTKGPTIGSRYLLRRMPSRNSPSEPIAPRGAQLSRRFAPAGHVVIGTRPAPNRPRAQSWQPNKSRLKVIPDDC
jgi:hypothetical protein